MSVGKETGKQPRQGVGLQGDLGLWQREQSKVVTNHQKSRASELDPGCAEGTEDSHSSGGGSVCLGSFRRGALCTVIAARKGGGLGRDT